MNIGTYIKEKKENIILFIILVIILLFLLDLFGVNKYLTIMVLSLLSIYFIVDFFTFYLKRKKYYDNFLNNLNLLDKKYLILETLEEPEFLDGKVFYDALYKIDKSMMENINNYRNETEDFKEYVEMWIHEIKIPIAGLMLMYHNNKTINKNFLDQLNSLDNLTDQILYYVRSNYAEKDFLIKEASMDKIINEVLLKNKDSILENHIDVTVDVKNVKVLTDSKWLVFILNQIINNSIKYSDNSRNSYIMFYIEDNEKETTLHIKDNGIGVNASDLKHVFDKSFTGENGRKMRNSTGFGLYISKKLIEKLGHKISATSEENKYFEITITFGKNDLYKI
ncbi:aTPase/histidine kinase/DNA gyrase B/HSP90 domain protein [Firmicutes bacterium CAG:582]|nr:aTPase/histidine kinase/DNA gyrase B/HSP90 domain protein [Firmicutes bacterium CAG:582]